MSPYLFGQHAGHVSATADRIARRHGARHINYTEPRGGRRGWFECPGRGEPFDAATARAVLGAIAAAGGLESMREP